MNTEKIMISSKILREIISRTFNIPAREIKLEGELDPETSYQNKYHDGSRGYSKITYKIWGYSPEKGFIDLSNNMVGYYSTSNYAGESTVDEPGKRICDIPDADQYIFFLIRKRDISDWEGCSSHDWIMWRLYKAPDFREYWERVEEEDLKRWASWLEQ
jgi:hypothetical protein